MQELVMIRLKPVSQSGNFDSDPEKISYCFNWYFFCYPLKASQLYQ